MAAGHRVHLGIGIGRRDIRVEAAARAGDEVVRRRDALLLQLGDSLLDLLHESLRAGAEVVAARSGFGVRAALEPLGPCPRLSDAVEPYAGQRAVRLVAEERLADARLDERVREAENEEDQRLWRRLCEGWRTSE